MRPNEKPALQERQRPPEAAPIRIVPLLDGTDAVWLDGVLYVERCRDRRKARRWLAAWALSRAAAPTP